MKDTSPNKVSFRNSSYRIKNIQSFFFIVLALLTTIVAPAQENATFREFNKEYTTYSFSDPDPIPAKKKIYPYFRFDGFTDKAVTKEWKVVELENDYIKVQLLPEIGGKIWTAIDKKSGKDFLYNNGVVKFRDIALRGPWVSGGIEFNYGIIGHTPNTATPVDYLVRKNLDGSVSCFVSTLDLLTRTRWVLEVKLEKDKVYFSTNSYWFNSTAFEKPYYTWMNAGIPVGNNVQFLYPGSHYIKHGGESHQWPLDGSGRHLNFYLENAFEGSKSYHVLGVHSNYFGGYWAEEDFGMIHFSKRSDKLGKKIFLWAQSQQGKIWEDLLTDNSGQYVEIQSGRLFNQNIFESSFTPFKQLGFAPYSSERWSEYWYPFQGLEGFTTANLLGAFNIEAEKQSLSIKFSPVQSVRDTLTVYSKEGLPLKNLFVKASPMEVFEKDFKLGAAEQPAYLKLKGHIIKFNDQEKSLSRPLTTPENFKPESAYGLYLQGRDLFRFRNYQLAEEKIMASLKKDSLFPPSLVEMAKIKLFRMQNDVAFTYAKKALSIDTYNPKANFYYGVAASNLNRYYDALDGFEVASLSHAYRNASYTALSKIYMKERDFFKAEEYVRLSLQNNPENLEALKLLYVLIRISHDQTALQETIDKIQNLNPLDHFLGFETYYSNPTKENEDRFKSLIKNELPFETYLELAIWYYNINRIKESKKVLELAPKNLIGFYWLAFLNREMKPELSEEYLKKAQEASADFIFPFRQETADVLQWASSNDVSWKPDYLLALIEDFRGNRQKAFSLIKSHDNIDFAPFYVVKAQLDQTASKKEKLKYFQEAASLEPKQWRYGIFLAEAWIELDQAKKATEILEKYFKADKDNYILGLAFVSSLMQADRYEKAEKILSILKILPFEGANDAREYYRQTKLMLAYQEMEKGNFNKALKKIDDAELWPENLGVGKPYPEMINNDLENSLRAAIYKKSGKNKFYKEHLKKLEIKDPEKVNFLERIKAISKLDKRLF